MDQRQGEPARPGAVSAGWTSGKQPARPGEDSAGGPAAGGQRDPGRSRQGGPAASSQRDPERTRRAGLRRAASATRGGLGRVDQRQAASATRRGLGGRTSGGRPARPGAVSAGGPAAGGQRDPGRSRRADLRRAASATRGGLGRTDQRQAASATRRGPGKKGEAPQPALSVIRRKDATNPRTRSTRSRIIDCGWAGSLGGLPTDPDAGAEMVRTSSAGTGAASTRAASRTTTSAPAEPRRRAGPTWDPWRGALKPVIRLLVERVLGFGALLASDHRQGRARPWRDELRGPCCAAHYSLATSALGGRARAASVASSARPARPPPGTRGPGRPFQAGDPTSGRARPRVRSGPCRRITGRAALVPGGTSSAARAAQRTTGLATSALRGGVALRLAAGRLAA